MIYRYVGYVILNRVFHQAFVSEEETKVWLYHDLMRDIPHFGLEPPFFLFKYFLFLFIILSIFQEEYEILARIRYICEELVLILQ